MKIINKGAMFGFHIWADKDIKFPDTLIKAAKVSPKKFPPNFFPNINPVIIVRIPINDIVKAIPWGLPENIIKNGVRR